MVLLSLGSLNPVAALNASPNVPPNVPPNASPNVF
jgi:hypothetical protein